MPRNYSYGILSIGLLIPIALLAAEMTNEDHVLSLAKSRKTTLSEVAKPRLQTEMSTIDLTEAQSLESVEKRILIELKDEPTLVVHNELKALKKSGRSIESRVAAHRALLKQDHDRIGKILTSHKNKSRARHFFSAFNGVSVSGLSLDEAKALFEGDSSVVRVMKDELVHATLLDSVSIIQATEAWGRPASSGLLLDGSGIQIGIIDTGIDYTHPDLGGCLGAGCKVVGGYDFVNNDSDPMDDQGHGTHVAATAAGLGFYKNGQTTGLLPGIAPGAKLWSFKVLDSQGSGYSSAIIAAIERCADPNQDGKFDDHLDVCNMSLGGVGNPDDPQSLAVDRATSLGVLFVVAAGNNGPFPETIKSPGTARTALTVGAACKPADFHNDPMCQDLIANFSSRGPVNWRATPSDPLQTLNKPDIVTPGHKICAAQWGDWHSVNSCLDDAHIAISGTSMATPVAAGAAAILKQAKPDLSPVQIKEILMSTATSLGYSESMQGKGLLNLVAALDQMGVGLNTTAAPSGLPLAFQDSPLKTVSAMSRSFRLMNRSSAPQNYSTSFSSTVDGLLGIIEPGQFTLAPGQGIDLKFTLQMDYSIAPSNAVHRGKVEIRSENSALSIPVTLSALSRLSADKKIDFGINLPENPEWNQQAVIYVKNSITDSAIKLKARIQCCTHESGAPATQGVLIEPSQPEFSVGAGGSYSLGVSIQTLNSQIANGRYQAELILESDLETKRIPMTFYKGYGFRFTFSPKAPEDFLLHSPTASYYFLPQSKTIDIFTPIPGPWNAEGSWWTPNEPVNFRVVIKPNLSLDPPLQQVALDREEAIHTITLNPQGPNGAIPVGALGSYRFGFFHKQSGQNISHLSPFKPGQQFKVNSIPADFVFLTTVGLSTPDYLLQYFYRLDEGIQSSMTLANQPRDLKQTILSAFENRSDADFLNYVVPGHCMPRYAAPYSSLKIDCMHLMWDAFKVSANQPKKIFSYSNSTKDLSQMDFPAISSMDYQLSKDDGTMFGSFYVTTPSLFISKNQSYAWSHSIDNPSLNPAQFLSRANIKHFTGEIPIGPAPLRDATEWSNFGNQEVTLKRQKDAVHGTHLIGLGGIEYASKTNASGQDSQFFLRRDGQTVAKGFIQLNSGNVVFGKLVPARYEFEMTRTLEKRGVTPLKSRTVSSFSIVDAGVAGQNPVDENPPVMTRLQFIANGITQGTIQPGAPIALVFGLDAVGGISKDANGNRTRLTDEITSVKVSRLLATGRVWSEAPIIQLTDGSYRTDLSGQESIDGKYFFKIEATDRAKNTFLYEFEMPAGTLVMPPAPSDLDTPQLSITFPKNLARVLPGRTLRVTATASDDQEIDHSEIRINGKTLCSRKEPEVRCDWLVPHGSGGIYTLEGSVWDKSGKRSEAQKIRVTSGSLPGPSPSPSPTGTPKPAAIF